METTDLDDINAKVVEMIEEDPELSWDDAIWKLAGENTDDDDEVSDDGTH